MDDRKAYEDIKGNKREGLGGRELHEGQLVTFPTTFFWPSRSTIWFKVRLAQVPQEP